MKQRIKRKCEEREKIQNRKGQKNQAATFKRIANKK